MTTVLLLKSSPVCGYYSHVCTSMLLFCRAERYKLHSVSVAMKENNATVHTSSFLIPINKMFHNDNIYY